MNDFNDIDVLAGPNGFLPREIIEMHPNAPFIKRQGEVNAWDNANFRAAVRATGKKQVILTGIVTDVRRSPTVISLSLLTIWLPGMHGLPRALPSGRRLSGCPSHIHVCYCVQPDEGLEEYPWCIGVAPFLQQVQYSTGQ